MLAAYMPGRRLHRYKDDFDGMFLCCGGGGDLLSSVGLGSDWLRGSGTRLPSGTGIQGGSQEHVSHQGPGCDEGIGILGCGSGTACILRWSRLHDALQ